MPRNSSVRHKDNRFVVSRRRRSPTIRDALMMVHDLSFLLFEEISFTNGTTNHHDDEDVRRALYISTSVIVFYIPLICLSNFLIFWGIVLYPGFYNTNNLLLLSMAVSDFLLGVFYLPMVVLSRYNKEIINGNKYLCLLRMGAAITSMGGSLCSLLAITIDRYLAVIWPLRYRLWVTTERSLLLLLFIWLYILTLAFLPLMGLNRYDYKIHDPRTRCNFYEILPNPYVAWVTIGNTYICVFVSAVLDIHVVIVINKQVQRFRAESNVWSRDNVRTFNHRINTVKISVVLMLLFVILWVPYLLVVPLKVFRLISNKHAEIAKAYTILFAFANSFANAPVYAMLRSEYMKVYVCMLSTCPWSWVQRLKQLHITTNASYTLSTELIKTPKLSVDEVDDFNVDPPRVVTSQQRRSTYPTRDSVTPPREEAALTEGKSNQGDGSTREGQDSNRSTLSDAPLDLLRMSFSREARNRESIAKS